MAKPNSIELPDCEPIPILHEDRSVIAVDKPRGWMLLPVSWQNTGRNLQAAINSSITARDFWARSRGIRFLRYVHRLDAEWTCRLKLAPDPRRVGRMKVDAREGKEAETQFRVLQKKEKLTLVEARPFTGRTHQIRVHLAESGCPVISDEIYGREDDRLELGLRAVRLAYADPFTRRRVDIQAPKENFLKEYGFDTCSGGLRPPPKNKLGQRRS